MTLIQNIVKSSMAYLLKLHWISYRSMAMQILTADVMQMLLDFKEETDIIPEIMITKQALYVRFETGNIFEGNYFTGESEYNAMKEHYDILNFTLRLTKRCIQIMNETQI